MTEPQAGHTTPLPSSAKPFGVLLCLYCAEALCSNRAGLDRYFHFIPSGDTHHG